MPKDAPDVIEISLNTFLIACFEAIRHVLNVISRTVGSSVVKEKFLTNSDSRNRIALVGPGPGRCLTKVIVAQLSLLLDILPLAPIDCNELEISSSIFLIACMASYQKYV